MTSYTNKKWVLLAPSSGVDNNWHITDDGDTCVLHAYGFNHAVDDDSKALAKRAHACLTACAGIPTPRLSAGDTGILAHSMELKKWCGELLTVLEEVTCFAELAMMQANKDGAGWDIKRDLANARSAIAKHKGGTA